MHITGYVTEEIDELKIENIGHKHRNSPRMPMNYYQQYIPNCSWTTLASIDQNLSSESILNCPIWTEFILENRRFQPEFGKCLVQQQYGWNAENVILRLREQNYQIIKIM